MEISEVRVKLVGSSTDRLRAFCSITLDGEFVVRDLKIIDGASGPFVAMPSRKLADRCPNCRSKTHLRARYCDSCGTRLRDDRVPRDRSGRSKLHADIAHPINSACRERIQKRVIEAYEEELALSKQPGYVPKELDDEELSDYDEVCSNELRSEAPTPAKASGPATDRVGPSESETSVAGESPAPAPPESSDRPGGEEQDGFGTGIL